MSTLEELLAALPVECEERNGTGLRTNYAVGFNDCLQRTKEALLAVLKPCAAKIGNHECLHERVEGKLFCARHMHASNRIHLPTVTMSPELLAYKMNRDGYPQ